MGLSAKLIRKLEDFDPKTKDMLLCFMEEIEEKTTIIAVGRSDFNDLKDVVRQLAEAQNRTEKRVEELAEAQNRTEKRVEELAEAQNRTEKRVEELAEAQNRTEKRVEELAEAQNRTEKRVEELAEAQNRTEKRVEELAEAQNRTEKRLEALAESQQELAVAQKKTEASVNALAVTVKDLQVQVGGLSMAVGYGIEDKLMPYLRRFALKEHGVEVTLIDRRNIIYPDGKYDEINLYAEGIKRGHSVFLIGECKAQPGKKDFDRFDKMLARLQQVLKGDVIPFMVGYHYAPEVETYAAKEYPHILRYKTFQISNLEVN